MTELTRYYDFPEVRFHPLNHCLHWHDNSQTPLTFHESCLLSVLCRHAGELLTYNVLAHHLFQESYDAEQRLITLVTALRSKLIKNGDFAIHISIVRNHGIRVAMPRHSSENMQPFPNQQPPSGMKGWLRRCWPWRKHEE
ncbi:hypothetical protein VST7929_01027 [Vibrio stylophorae]|uniref:OmpR/PhoB-type domain-containing protein n=1 Tax=Vibrio stylophorae TaxID=659351 RepID=A0ABN8DQZ5_9VIBR|nr:helix-turn-helix domain-containing protein [Vibrio stylophorae]CAH0533165.1 hypothetical protein VST7929_01027 [Vibrio stylophorae]